MSAPIPVRDLLKVILPRGHAGGCLSMLTAYFDDSGTHPNSDIVIVGGVLGNSGDIETLDWYWEKALADPVCGYRPPLKRFHMADCQAGEGEFAGWSRTETDFLCNKLRKAIIDSHVAGYMCAISRKHWDDLIVGHARAIFGDAEGNCIRNCFVKSIQWANECMFDPQMSFVIDDRPSPVKRDAHVVYDAFKRETQEPSLVGFGFYSSYKIRPLQAADMLAWETYQFAKAILKDGSEAAPRSELTHLTSNMKMVGQMAISHETIQKYLDLLSARDEGDLEQIANHFTFFDPENPDYSYLKKK